MELTSSELLLETRNAVDSLYKVSYLISKSLFKVNTTLFIPKDTIGLGS